MKRTLIGGLVTLLAALLFPVSASAEPAPQPALNLPFAAGGSVTNVVVTPDGTRAVYTARSGAGEPLQLWVAPLDASAPPILIGEGPLTAPPIVTPDSTKAVYLAIQDTPGVTEAYVAELDGSNTFRANPPLPAGRRVNGDLVVTNDSKWLIYRADQQVDERYELFRTFIGGGGPGPGQKINGTPVADGDVSNGFRLTPNGTRIVYRADRDVDGTTELFSAPTNGVGAELKLNDIMIGPKAVTTFKISPSGTRVVYRADQTVDERYELFSVAADGGAAPVRISDALGGPADVAHQFDITADSTTVVYQADREIDSIDRVFVTPIDGSAAPVPVSPPPVAGRIVFEHIVSPDGKTIAYRADHDVDNRVDLYAVPVTGGAPTSIATGEGGIFDPRFTPDSTKILFGSRRDDPTVNELYVRSSDGSTPLRKVNPDLSADRETSSVIGFDPSGDYVIYRAGYDIGSFEADLYVSPIDGPRVAVQLNDPHPRGGFTLLETMSPKGHRVVFGNDTEVLGEHHLYSTPIAEAIARLASVDSAARFVPLPPARLFDTRTDKPGPGPKGLVGANGSIDVQVTGVAGVPADAVAVVMNVTATEAIDEGFVTAWPTGSPRPNASNLNLTMPGQTRPNLVTVPVGAGGKVSLYTQSGTHLLADVAGYYVDADMARPDGRVVPVTPTRVFDTRPGQPGAGPKGLVGAGGTIDVSVLGVGDVPTSGVSAIVLNVTATQASAAGFVTVWPQGAPQPLASVLNLNGADDTAPNLVIVPVSATGMVSFYSQSGTHLLADVTGYVTDATAPVDDAGLFVPLSPTRVFDTRPGQPAPGPKGVVGANNAIAPTIAGAAGIPDLASAAVLNTTATEAATGFVTAWPDGLPRPLASTLNLIGPDDTRPNAAILPVGAGGRIAFYTQSGAHLLADTAGYYLG